MTLYERVIC